MSFCDDESMCEEVVQMETLCDDFGFLDSLLSESSVDVSFSFTLDTGTLEDVISKFFDRLLDEKVPLETVIDARKNGNTCADVVSVFNKGFVCLFDGMYSLQCLLKATTSSHDTITSIFEALECGVAYIGPTTGFCAGDYHEGSLMIHMHEDDGVYDAFFSVMLIHGKLWECSWEPGGGLVTYLMHGRPSFLVWDPSGVRIY
ncbi:hypothetical protein GOP47_0022124 [Adiantum capillus-veneris]|uniref:Uncharacterized protein n=1 Tax=Adiantum capillus-veneris TaxID=13818 RepID=A0A9D4Z7J5_ADICA|nr:hypothetical protein GOP47_0022124 [Adiantum capillus-veneris]